MSGWKTNRAQRFSGFIFCAALVLVAGIAGCKKNDSPSATIAQILRISQRNEPATLDPHLATLPDEFFVIRALSEGLLVPAPEGGAPLPAAAASWNVSADGRVYTFKLRPDGKWSNGDRVTSADFVYSIHRALSPALAAPKASLFFPLKNAEAFYHGAEKDFSKVGARALDDLRLELTLTEPTADFLAMIASGPWIPVHRGTIEKAGAMDQRGTNWTRPGNFIGNGPFTLTTWSANQEVMVSRNPAYRDSAHVFLSEIHFVAFDNGDSEERAFRAGQLDVTMAVPATKLDPYRTKEPAKLKHTPLHETRYLSLNTTRAPLNDPRVRQALALALNRTAITEKVLRGGQQPAFSFIPSGLGGYVSRDQLTEDSAKARQLLSEAGFPEGRNFLRLELTSWATTPAVLEAIQQMWRQELGIEIALVQREARTHLAALVAGDYDIALATAIPDYNGASDLCGDLQGNNPGNYPHWKNPAFDKLTVEASRATSDSSRNAAYQQAEKILLDEMPLIPLYFNAQNFLIQPRVKNWRADRLWTRFYQGVSLE